MKEIIDFDILADIGLAISVVLVLLCFWYYVRKGNE